MKDLAIATERTQRISANGTGPDHQGTGGGTTASAADLDPVISIVVPALNEEKLIRKTLGCFPAELRRRRRMELIVSDGGSTDGTVAISRELADIVVEHTGPRRQTIAEGRNCGADVASGDLLVFINADTVPVDPEAFLAELFTIASGGPGTGKHPMVAYACPVEIAPSERKISDRLFHTFFNNYVRLLNTVGLGMGRGECQVIDRKAFLAVGGYQDHMAAGEDFDLYRRLTRLGRIGHRNRLMVYESPRRFRRYGYLRVLLEWTLNALSVMFLRRSISKEWEQIR